MDNYKLALLTCTPGEFSKCQVGVHGPEADVTALFLTQERVAGIRVEKNMSGTERGHLKTACDALADNVPDGAIDATPCEKAWICYPCLLKAVRWPYMCGKWGKYGEGTGLPDFENII